MTSEECPNGYSCNLARHLCRTSCDGFNPCANGYTCDTTKGVCPGIPIIDEKLCDGKDGNASKPKILIVPSTTIPTDVAAAAWGATYKASCVDTPTLEAFIKEHYGKGPEINCYEGKAF